MTSETIDIPTADGTAEGYVTRPDSGDHPGIVFFMDAIGLRPRIEEMADRIASWGYVVLAPNLFYRSGTAVELAPKADLLVAENREAFFAEAMPRVRELTNDQAMADADTFIEVLQNLPGIAGGRIGVTGYCMGGGLAFLTACHRPDVVAVAGSFHAGGLATDAEDSPHRQASCARAELYFGHADNDRSMPPEAIATFEAALGETDLTFTSTVYDGAAHGYTMADTAMYDEAATERHFDVLKDLLGRNLQI